MAGNHWRDVALDDILAPVSRSVLVSPSHDYGLLGVRWYGNGCHLHAQVRGVDLKTRTLNQIAAGNVTYNKMWVGKGAFAVVDAEYDGLFATSEYPTFEADVTQAQGAFLRFVMMQGGFLESARELCRGTTSRARLNPQDFLKLRVALPPLQEQRKIAAILSSVDDAIEATRAVIDHLGVVKNAMMAELLARGLPGRHTRFKQTDIGELPEEWATSSYAGLAAKVPRAVQSGPFGSALSVDFAPSWTPPSRRTRDRARRELERGARRAHESRQR